MNELGRGLQPIILLTGCINPEDMSFTKLKNSSVRRLHYIEAIEFYLRNTDSLVVFVENSGVDLSNEFVNSPHKERLECLSFFGNNFDRTLGKGYGEMLILRHAFQNSTFIVSGSSICKITGRYKVLNIRRILKSYCKYECSVMVNLPRQLKYADSRIFIADRDFYTNFLLKMVDRINDSKGAYFEHVLNRAVLMSVIEKKHSYLPFKYCPRLKGKSGTDNLDYDDSFNTWFPQNLMQIIQFNLFLKEWDIKYSVK